MPASRHNLLGIKAEESNVNFVSLTPAARLDLLMAFSPLLFNKIRVEMSRVVSPSTYRVQLHGNLAIIAQL